MVAFSNDGVSNEYSRKRSSESGSYSHFGAAPENKIQKVWAVRDFPPGCGRNAPKVKYYENRVFAVRDFPPFCGRNAPKPTEHDHVCGNEASKRVVVFDMAVSQNEGAVGSIVLPEIVKKKENDAAGNFVGKDILYSENACEKASTARNAFGSGDGIVPVVHGLMAETYCPWRPGNQINLYRGLSRNEIAASQDESDHQKGTAGRDFTSRDELVRPIVLGLMAEPYCSWRQEKQTSLDGLMSENQVQKPKMIRIKIVSSAAARNSVLKPYSPRRPFDGKKSGITDEAAEGCSSAEVMVDDGTCGALVASKGGSRGLDWKKLPEDSPIVQGKCEFDTTLPPSGPKSSSYSDARSKVRDTLRLFHSICRKILRGEESKSRAGEPKHKQKNRIDLQAAKIVEEKGKEVNSGAQILGKVPGVEVGDAFQYRVELRLVGVHRLYQGGIDSMNNGGLLVATSIVASGAYDDDMGDADELIYSGQGGNVLAKDKTPEDQKLVKGNLALKNSIATRNPVRVIRGYKETKTSDSNSVRPTPTYVYDGLYTVDNYWREQGPHGKMVFMFKLVRIPGQPDLVWKELKSTNKSKVRHGVCVPDITEGKESLPITAVNTFDSEKPPPFKYIKKMMYPSGFCAAPSKGCDCIGRCSDTMRCSCVVKNGGEIPYNHNGAIVEVKPLVYECGPSCKCPPSCYNRVSQHGIKVPLEIFKTDTRGWGVRALTSISSGTFICEYAGELLDDREAEQKIGHDEYLFDIGQNYGDCAVNSSGQADINKFTEEGGYTIDAAQYGNVGRFINHSCSPNLYAQNVVYDHEDKKMPHIMLFAADNIPPLKELTYHYNYSVNQVHDSDGNIKVKKCFCGSSDCSGRMY